ncbi:amidohydrolase family protein [Actinomadura madurae]|uniref:amidohydrolase family protein n=1 Tax=Actinomadura madurae TaxID=1993 RepID=UPI0015EEFFFD|nr:amidohydrolase family protein [Actinomadura madurae]
MTTTRLLKSAQVLLGDPRLRDVRQVDLLISDGVITAIGPDIDTDAPVEDVSWAWIIPGLVDTHQHLWQATMRALTSDFAGDDYFWIVRRNHAARHTAEDVYNGTFGGAVSLLDAGTTCAIDYSHCNLTPDHADAGIRGFIDSGLRGVWSYGYYHQPTEDNYFTSPQMMYDDSRRIRSTYLPASTGRVSFGVSPTEMVRAPFDQIRDEFLMGRELDALVNPHSNTRFRPGYPSDIKQWHEAGLLWKKQLHVHCNASDAEDLQLLADSGAAVCSTPETELGMGMGYMVLRAADRLGIPCGIGADIQSNNGPDLFTAMRVALGSERGRYHQPIIESGGTSAIGEIALRTEDVLHYATLGGATALGLEDVCGSIEEGKAADLVLIRRDSPRLHPVVDPVAAIAMHVTLGDIDTVMVAGETVKENGRLREDLRRRAVDALETSGDRIAKAVADHGGWRPARPEWVGTPEEHSHTHRN